jgi:hypothetical protein
MQTSKGQGLVSSLLIVALLGQSLLSTGCSFLRSGTEVIKIKTEEGAEIVVDSKSCGPVTEVILNRAQTHTIRAVKDGRGAIATVTNKVHPLGYIDMAIGYTFFWTGIGIPWLLGTFSDGFWDLDPDEVTIILPAKKPAALEERPREGAFPTASPDDKR